MGEHQAGAAQQRGEKGQGQPLMPHTPRSATVGTPTKPALACSLRYARRASRIPHAQLKVALMRCAR